jgi:TldD protein
MRSTSYHAPFFPGATRAIDRDVCARLIAIALEHGGDHADLFFEYRAIGSYAFEEGILKSASKSVSLGLGVRVQIRDATGYAYTQDLSQEKMERVARIASQIARDGKPLPPQPLQPPLALPGRYDLPSCVLDQPGDAKRNLLANACHTALAVDPRIIKAEAGLTEAIREILIASSSGVFAYDVQPMLRVGIRAICEHDGKRRIGSSGGGGRTDLAYFESHPIEDHAKRAAHQALVLLDAKPAPAGELDVVLAPGDSGILLHEAVGHGLEADFNRKGTSRYAGRIGEQVASNLCTVVDDATLDRGRGSINIDDEGVVPERVTLIEGGVLCGYMHDRHSARHYGLEPTGNGRRESFASHPLPRMTNTYLLAGTDEPEDIVRSVARGVYAKSFGGGQVDISNGDFVFSLTESYLIEDGKLTAPLNDVNLIGNGPDVLRRVTMVGHDFQVSDGIWTCGKEGQSVPVGVGCPTVRIAGITVGGTNMG